MNNHRLKLATLPAKNKSATEITLVLRTSIDENPLAPISGFSGFTPR